MLPLPNLASPRAATFASLLITTSKPNLFSTNSFNGNFDHIGKLGELMIIPLSISSKPGHPIPTPLTLPLYPPSSIALAIMSHNFPTESSAEASFSTFIEKRLRISPLSLIKAPLMDVPPISTPIAIIIIASSYLRKL